MNTERLYIRGCAYRGENCSWGERFEFPHSAPDDAVDTPEYDSRRMAEVVKYAMEASVESLSTAGGTAAGRSEYGIVTLTHNGPCVYSEDFYTQVLREKDPALVSPMLFSESVLNIAASHLSLAVKSCGPVYALHTDLANYFSVLESLFMLTETCQFKTCIFCAFDEFSDLPRRVFPKCGDYPGRAFVTGAAAAVVSANRPSAESLFSMDRPYRQGGPEEFAGYVDRLEREGPVELVISSYGSSDLPSGVPSRLKKADSFISADAAGNEQGFMVGRTVELLGCVLEAEKGGARVLVQSDGERLSWITLRRETL
ncbi:MAG: hypothetical protein R6V03_00310 [Kiritimatiellia bacterium]